MLTSGQNVDLVGFWGQYWGHLHILSFLSVDAREVCRRPQTLSGDSQYKLDLIRPIQVSLEDYCPGELRSPRLVRMYLEDYPLES